MLNAFIYLVMLCVFYSVQILPQQQQQRGGGGVKVRYMSPSLKITLALQLKMALNV